ncbi:phosphatidylinositol phosphatase PTPRQ-like isoform X3 [Mya arenaria]|uniref:phosphatidylinositol phosphatase PTPRQ-like isoform X3 n=1 Tax=Mya arenaria TaxID=6604 RepID=UPI0022E43148|nr:phosphatidylinositol phosphatase PTPRQ-like isoform X3 [Mya arenaria]
MMNVFKRPKWPFSKVLVHLAVLIINVRVLEATTTKSTVSTKVSTNDTTTPMAATPSTTAPPTQAPTQTPASSTATLTTITQAPSNQTATSPTTTSTTQSDTTNGTQKPEPAITIGSNCSGHGNESSDNEWCGNGVDGQVVCFEGICTCSTGHFPINSTACLNETVLNTTEISIISTDVTSFTLSWENPAIQESQVNVTVVANNADCDVGQAKNATCAGLEPGCNYTVKVKVQSGTFEGFVLTSASLVPESPGQLNTTLCGVFEAPNVTLCWDPSEGCVDYYSVNVKQSGGEVVFSTQTSDGANFTTVTNLTAGTEYNITIFAYSLNKSSASTLDTFTTQSSEPSEPLNLTVEVLGEKEVKLNWESPEHPNGMISAYTVCYVYKHYRDQSYFGTNCTNKTGPEIALIGNVETNLSLPFAGAFYNFSVAAVNQMFTGRSSSAVARSNESTPGNITVLNTQATNTTITLIWSRPPVPNGNIIKYQVQWYTGNKMCSVVIKADSNGSVDNGDNCGSDLPERIVVNQKDMNYTISGLDHYKNYSMWVTPFTAAGSGQISNTTQQTTETRPGPVGIVTIRDIGPTAINVTWTIPEINPGPTNYTAVANSTIPGQEHIARCEVEEKDINYTSTGCEIRNLREFWKYKVEVIAKTKGGISEPKLSEAFYTQESTPGTPLSLQVFNYTPPACDATKVKVTWTEPNLLDRHANITQYIVQTVHHNDRVFTYPVVNPQPFARNNSQFSWEQDNLEAERTYQWQLFAVGRNGKGFPANYTFSTGICAPPKMDSVLEKLEITSSSVIFNLDPYFFTNEKQGKIMAYGMVGGNGRDEVRTVNGDTVLSLGSWSKFTSNNHQGVYRFNFNLTPNVNGKLRLEVGQNRTCTKEDFKEFCNGPLPSGLELWVKAYACTAINLCTVSEHYGPFTIQQPYQDTKDSGVDGALIALPILIAILILISMFLFLWWRGAIDPLQWKNQLIGGGKKDVLITLPEIADLDRSIPIATYSEALADLHRDTNLILSDQYEEIKRRAGQIEVRSGFEAANLEPNKPKNRWVNILPFDHSRVNLQQLDDDDPESDYINANYMPGFHHQREFIATQGPLPGTIDDFWRMVWEQNVMVIVMLTQCKEGNRVKCEMYWPDTVQEAKQYGDVVVNPTSITNMNKFNINIFDISHASDLTKTRKVLQFHYLDFMDFTAAVEVEHFIEFVRTVRGHVPHDMTSPMVIHCSAGVGRTGSYIAIDHLQEYLNSPKFSSDDHINIFDMVMEMREQRVNMVQTEAQYILIHDCFERMLEDKKKSLKTTESMEELYANQAYDKKAGANPFPDVEYENVNYENKQRTEL